MEINGPGYIAIQLKPAAVDSWLQPNEHSGWSAALTDALTTDTDESNGPPNINCYGSTRAISLKVAREYGGIGSSGGPVVSGRSDHGDFLVEQSVNDATPKIFELCCSGVQCAWVHIILLTEDDNNNVSKKLHIKLKDANISSFDFSGGRYFEDFLVPQSGTSISDTSLIHKQNNLVSPTQVVKYALWYTGVLFEHFIPDGANGVTSSGVGGWDTGADLVANSL